MEPIDQPLVTSGWTRGRYGRTLDFWRRLRCPCVFFIGQECLKSEQMKRLQPSPNKGVSRANIYSGALCVCRVPFFAIRHVDGYSVYLRSRRCSHGTWRYSQSELKKTRSTLCTKEQYVTIQLGRKYSTTVLRSIYSKKLSLETRVSNICTYCLL